MTTEREIRASYTRNTIVVYQAYSGQIADAAMHHKTFVTPFSFNRMTWIKPSFLWLMHRSNWGRKSNQERTLAIHITRAGWEQALSEGVLTHPEPGVYKNGAVWRDEFEAARVHIQWDTERSLRGAGLNYFSIQVGIGRQLIREYVDQWIVRIEDISPTVAKIRSSLKSGDTKRAKQLIPSERVYPVIDAIGKRVSLG